MKVVAWRMLSRLKSEGWPKDLLDMMYLENETLRWAKASGEGLEESEKIIHRDVNGVILKAGNNVVLIKDLKVKGSSMVAKQGTAVRRISLGPVAAGQSLPNFHHLHLRKKFIEIGYRLNPLQIVPDPKMLVWGVNGIAVQAKAH